MKKIRYIIITTFILSLCLAFTSFAAEKPTVTFSEDFKTMYFDDYTYYQRDLNGFESAIDIEYICYPEEHYEYDAEIGQDVLVSVENNYIDEGNPVYAEYKLSATQEKTVKSIDIAGDDIIVYITVYYKDGTSLTVDLLREDYIDDYEALKEGKSDNYLIEYGWPEDNYVKVTKDNLIENEATEIKLDYYLYDFQYIYITSEDEVLTYTPGYMYTIENEYYYLDFEENDIHGVDYEFFYSVEESGITVKLHKITDEKVLENIKIAEEKYYDDDLGFIYDDELASNISYVFLIIIFGVIPGIIFVVTFVFAIIKKKTYRRLLFTASFFTLAEIIVFIIFMIIANYK